MAPITLWIRVPYLDFTLKPRTQIQSHLLHILPGAVITGGSLEAADTDESKQSSPARRKPVQRREIGSVIVWAKAAVRKFKL